MVVILVEFLKCGNHKGRNADFRQGTKNKIPREGGESGSEVEEDSRRRIVPVEVVFNKTSLNFKNILKNISPFNESTLKRDRPIGDLFVSHVGKRRSKKFRVSVRARERARFLDVADAGGVVVFGRPAFGKDAKPNLWNTTNTQN